MLHTDANKADGPFQHSLSIINENRALLTKDLDGSIVKIGLFELKVIKESFERMKVIEKHLKLAIESFDMKFHKIADINISKASTKFLSNFANIDELVQQKPFFKYFRLVEFSEGLKSKTLVFY